MAKVPARKQLGSDERSRSSSTFYCTGIPKSNKVVSSISHPLSPGIADDLLGVSEGAAPATSLASTSAALTNGVTPPGFFWPNPNSSNGNSLLVGPSSRCVEDDPRYGSIMSLQFETEKIVVDVLCCKSKHKQLASYVLKKTLEQSGSAARFIVSGGRMLPLVTAELASSFAKIIGIRRIQVNRTLHNAAHHSSQSGADLKPGSSLEEIDRSRVKETLVQSLLEQPTAKKDILADFFCRFYVDLTFNDWCFAQTVVNTFLDTGPSQLLRMIDSPELLACSVCTKLAELQAAAAMIAHTVYNRQSCLPDVRYDLLGNFQYFTVIDAATLQPHTSPRDPNFNGSARICLVNDAASLLQLLIRIQHYISPYEEDRLSENGGTGGEPKTTATHSHHGDSATNKGKEPSNWDKRKSGGSPKLAPAESSDVTEGPHNSSHEHGFGNLFDPLGPRNEWSTQRAPGAPVIAVGLEGMALGRYGPLCLLQLCLGSDPSTVYVIDVHVLGQLAFSLCTPDGVSIRSIFASRKVVKPWFDPRNDSDALYCQFGVAIKRSFCLQLAEGAYRRTADHETQPLLDLRKILSRHAMHIGPQAPFELTIDSVAKSIYHPESGGHYGAFQARPLHPSLLIYAAHGVRHLLPLYNFFHSRLPHRWIEELFSYSKHRAEWWKREDQ